MLQIIMGRSGSGKTEYMRKFIAQLVKSGKEKLMVIIPEQSSFETETSMLEMLGAKESSKVETVSFTRLVEHVLRKCGGIAGEKLSSGGRYILMSIAIDNAADNLTLYKNQAQKAELIPLMLSAVDEFKMCAVSTDMLREKAEIIEDETLASKLRETALITDCYNALLSNMYLDPMDDLTRLKDKLEKHPFFEGYTVLIDSFNGFTVQEMRIIELILRQCESCHVILSGNYMNTLDENNLFYTINRTKRDLTKLAKKCGIDVKAVNVFDEQYRLKSNGLKAIESSIYRTEKKVLDVEVNDVMLFSADDIYIEANHVARTIKRLVSKNDMRYSDFAIVCRQTRSYQGILDSALDKYGIPYFMDKPQDIDSKPLFALCLLIFDIALTSYSSDYIFKYLKTGLAGLTYEEIAELENYTFTWNISGRRWLEPFTAHPDGFNSEFNEKSKKELEHINELRQRVILPLKKFANQIENDNALEISKAIYELLCDINCAQNLQNSAYNLEHDGNPNIAEEQLRMWDTMMSILDQAAGVIGEKPISAKRYAKLLRTVITLSDVSFIPRTLDEVTIGTADRIRLASPKIVFIIGAIEGEFPHIPVAAGVFSDIERRTLLSLDIPMYDSISQLAVQEKYHVYCAVSSPCERLYISWYNSDLKGNIKKPSSIIREVMSILPKIKINTENELTLEQKLWAEKPAFELCTGGLKNTSLEYKQLQDYFKNNKDYSQKFIAAVKASKRALAIIEDKTKAEKLFSIHNKLSASQIEKYYLCRFQYFCKYGIRAKERKPAEIDALEYGSLMHFLLENILKNHAPKQLNSMNRLDLSNEINALLNDYVVKNLGGLDDKDERFKYLYYRLQEAVRTLIEHIAAELAQSEFEPVDFELNIAKGGDIEAYNLLLPDGREITVEGKVDRVDIMKKGEINYIRIIDYKTGTKAFKLSDVLYGLNMQMLIYLSAINAHGKARYNGKIVPAGVLYMPASVQTANTSYNADESEITSELNKKYAMNGLILDNNLVIHGMENEAKGIFIPVSLKGDVVSKGKDSLTSLEQMGRIFKYIDSLIADMAISLNDGKIYNIPAKGEYDACAWCPYKAVCGFEDGDKQRDILKLDKERIAQELAQKDEAEGGIINEQA